MSYWQHIIEEVTRKDQVRRVRNTSCATTYRQADTTTPRQIERYYIIPDIQHLYLTRQEAFCMLYIIQGYTMKATAKKLSLSPRTVEFYFKRIREKFSCKTRAELLTILAKHNTLAKLQQALPIEENE